MDVETYECEEEGMTEIWVADPCGGVFGGGSSEILVFHVASAELAASENLLDFWETELSTREPERCLKPEFLFTV